MGFQTPIFAFTLTTEPQGQLTNYHQYSLNIDITPPSHDAKPDWSLLYSSSPSYEIQDLTASSLQDMVDNFTSPRNEEFQRYVTLYSSNQKTRPPCGILCWRHHICSICHVDYDTFDHCLNTINAQNHDDYIGADDVTEILSLDSDYDNVFKAKGDDDNDKSAPIYNDDDRDVKNAFDWSSITDNSVDIFGNPIEVVPPCPNWNARCQPQYSIAPQQATPSYMSIIVYAIVGLLVFSIVLVTILCCFWPRHKMFSNEPRYVAVKTTDAMEGFDNAGETVGYY